MGFALLSSRPQFLGFDLSKRVDGAHVFMRVDHEVPAIAACGSSFVSVVSHPGLVERFP